MKIDSTRKSFLAKGRAVFFGFVCLFCSLSAEADDLVYAKYGHTNGTHGGKSSSALIALNTYSGENDMSYWLHRISHHAEVSHPLLDKGYLSIGWSDFSQKEFVEKVRAGNEAYFESAFDEEWGKRPRSRWSLWKYIADMKAGDLVIVPGWADFSIYRLVGDRPLIAAEMPDDLTEWSRKPIWKNAKGYLCRGTTENCEEIDLGFFWKVEPVQVGISRDKYADQPLTARMKIRSTTACLNDLQVSVQNAMTRFSENKPINLHSSILESSQKKVLAMIRDDLDPNKFEKLVKWYFHRVGATTTDIPAKNESGKEGDADVIAVFEGIKTIIYVQAKHHRGTTSPWASEQIKDYVRQRESADDGYIKIAWVISSADDYSEECRKLAQENHVLLVDGDEFAKMLLEAGIANLDAAFL